MEINKCSYPSLLPSVDAGKAAGEQPNGDPMRRQRMEKDGEEGEKKLGSNSRKREP
jgi:hypothetical protein